MTIGGALSELNNLLNADDIPCYYKPSIKAVMDTIALEQEPKWISVSERLPEITDYYLIQYSRKICNDELAVAYYSVEEKESDPDYEWEFKPICGEYKEVIAWMPLPEPYKAESEG